MFELIAEWKWMLVVYYIVPSLICLAITYVFNFPWEFRLMSAMGFLGAPLFLLFYMDINLGLFIVLYACIGAFFILPAFRRLFSEEYFFERKSEIMYKVVYPIMFIICWVYLCPFMIMVLLWEGRNLRGRLPGKKLVAKKPAGELKRWKDVRKKKEKED